MVVGGKATSRFWFLGECMSPDLKWLMLFQCGQISAASCVFHSHYHPEASLVPGLPLCWFCLPPIPSPFFPYSSDSPMLLHHHFQPYPPPLCREFCPPNPSFENLNPNDGIIFTVLYLPSSQKELVLTEINKFLFSKHII